ncbi:MAG: TonB-dependent receptor [Oceanicaulis sp.]|uniref:TonB-dependent receptor n=1 Tax=unclassified Oceanicaulis TaxID=2632123 RepID=UPI000C58F8B3|nr:MULTISPECIES: TonB-dependent receptor [unclassified Oceanicaulis]MBC37916.1 TonB-dependent receptor [Oceanicaulis sp.]MBG34675.1 TonB-dependent receptor [Oceanicaulis sp.]HBU63766.1 TonB-dependent receptor [Oceanicaulis sp.]HCR95096.1 TonB-dependent receptor [Oceanicaulis sp.]|tara:strand:+ start:5643 stop:7979 length:2337 start_codon:yes stop_codon:yes gene_type:complete
MTFKARLSACAALLALAPASTAFAQTEVNEQVADVITVTTQFREQSLADVPINVSAFNEELIERLDIRNMEDMALFTPGLVIQEQSPNNTGYSLRGITTDSGVSTAEARVAMFQDGLSISRSRGSYVELFDIERLEVAKGPQPTLFGRGALIGGINIIQNKAAFENSASVFAGLGNYDAYEVGGHVNYAIADTYGLRVAAVNRVRDGYIPNLGDGDDLQGRDVLAGRVVFSGEPTSSFSFDLIGNWQQDSGPGSSFKSGVIAPQGGSTNPYSAADLRVIDGFESNQGLGLDRTVWGITALTSWDINPSWNLSTVTGYREYDSVEIFDPLGIGFEALNFGEDATGRQTSHEMRLSFDNGGRFTAFGGVTYFYEANTQRIPAIYNEAVTQALFVRLGQFGNVNTLAGLLGVPASALTDLANPFPYSIAALSQGMGLVPLRPNYTEESANAGSTEALDFFADASFDVTDRLTVTAGLRYTDESKNASGYGGTSMGPNRVTFGQALILTSSPNGAEISSSADFDDWTYRVNAAYEVSDRMNAWVSYARGRSPDLISIDSNSPTLFSTSPAEIVDSLEVGAFFTLDRGTLTASIYESKYDNFRTSVFDPLTSTFVPQNSGSATQRGLELQGDFRITDTLDLMATYSYNLAKFDKTSNGVAQELGGNRFRYAPEHSFSLGARWEVLTRPWGTVTILPSFSWQSHVFTDNDNDRFVGVRQDSYGLLRARVRYDDPSERYFAEIYGNNIADQEYLIDAGNTGAGFGLPTFIAGAPRTYGFRIGASF